MRNDGATTKDVAARAGTGIRAAWIGDRGVVASAAGSEGAACQLIEKLEGGGRILCGHVIVPQLF